jgi:hypothetical protein
MANWFFTSRRRSSLLERTQSLCETFTFSVSGPPPRSISKSTLLELRLTFVSEVDVNSERCLCSFGKAVDVSVGTAVLPGVCRNRIVSG